MTFVSVRTGERVAVSAPLGGQPEMLPIELVAAHQPFDGAHGAGAVFAEDLHVPAERHDAMHDLPGAIHPGPQLPLAGDGDRLIDEVEQRVTRGRLGLGHRLGTLFGRHGRDVSGRGGEGRRGGFGLVGRRRSGFGLRLGRCRRGIGPLWFRRGRGAVGVWLGLGFRFWLWFQLWFRFWF